MIVAIDGPAASGKGRMVELLSKKLNLDTLDTGAIYRVITIALRDLGFDYNQMDDDKVKELDEILNSLDIEVEKSIAENKRSFKYYLNGVDVTKRLRDKDTSSHVSYVSSIIPIRLFATEYTRKYAEGKNIIMDGRDIGTYVFPNADVKIYLTADLEERAKRRYNQNIETGSDHVNFNEILENLKSRDYNDMYNKEIGALKQAKDAILVDNTGQNEEETLEVLINIIKEKMNV